MGVCLCKDKSGDGLSIDDETQQDPYTINSLSSGNINGISNNGRCRLNSNTNPVSLADRVDKLVKETLETVAQIVDNDPEPPSSMVQLHNISCMPKGWLCIVSSLMRVIPMAHAMGPSVITLLLDDSALPSEESVIEVANLINSPAIQTVSCERNLCVILGCLAEKLAGPCSIAVLNESTLNYLMKNINEGQSKDITLFSLIALEKFAQTAENKSTIKKKLATYDTNPLLKLESYANDTTDVTMRQIGFCAQWSLDNYFLIENRSYTYETVDVENINVMLNTKDVSEYLKISPDGLEARCDSYLFESVRSTYQVTNGAWYYEVLIITSGVMQIGWAQKQSNFMTNDGYGIGDDAYSIAFDGCRRLTWHKAKSTPTNLPMWQGGSICGCYIDLDASEVIFSLDGIETQSVNNIFNDTNNGFFPAASFMSFQQCRFNFGSEPFKYPPKRSFNNFNSIAVLNPQDKIILPRHLYLEELRKLSVTEDSCTLCFDLKASIRLIPCGHTGFCCSCAAIIQSCPICRGEIVTTAQYSNILDNEIEHIIDALDDT